MSTRRYRFLAKLQADREWLIEGDEAEHLSRVLRLEAGCEVEVTDGQGAWATGRIRHARGKAIGVDCSPTQIEASPRFRITVAVGALKPGFIDDLLPGLVELGMDQLVVFQQRGMAKSRLSDQACERWQRILTSALKQSKRATLPTLDVFGSLADLLQGVPGNGIVLRPDATTPLFELVTRLDRDVVLLVGGERGLDPEELALAQAAGYQAASMGPTILRAVTATLASVAVTALRRAAAPC